MRNLKLMIFFLSTFLVYSFSAKANCLDEKAQNWSPEFKKNILACAFDPTLNGAYVLSQMKEEGIDLGFFKKDKNNHFNSKPSAEEKWVGYKILPIMDGTQKGNFIFRDLNGDGKSDFLYRVVHDFSAVLRGVSLKSASQKTFDSLLFNFTENPGKNAITEFHHDDGHPLTVRDDKIVGTEKRASEGVPSYFRFTFQLNKTSRKFETQSVTPVM